VALPSGGAAFLKMSKYLQKIINWIAYNGTAKPSDSISDARWAAMVKHIQREYLLSD